MTTVVFRRIDALATLAAVPFTPTAREFVQCVEASLKLQQGPQG